MGRGGGSGGAANGNANVNGNLGFRYFCSCGECYAILGVALHDVINILGGLGTAHIAVFHYWVGIVTGVLKEEDITTHIAPTLGNGAVFFLPEP